MTLNPRLVRDLSVSNPTKLRAAVIAEETQLSSDSREAIDGVWSVGRVYDASALNHLLSTAIGRGARRFGRPRGREEGGKFE
jgi:hypothetical protein